MAFDTNLGDNLLVLGDNTIAFGTCMLGAVFGQVKSASLKRAADRDLLNNCHGNLRAAILKNARFELTMKTIFDLDVTPPGIGDTITLPYVAGGLIARIMDISIDWSEDGERELNIDASRWDSLGNASIYTYDGTAYA